MYIQNMLLSGLCPLSEVIRSTALSGRDVNFSATGQQEITTKIVGQQQQYTGKAFLSHETSQAVQIWIAQPLSKPLGALRSPWAFAGRRDALRRSLRATSRFLFDTTWTPPALPPIPQPNKINILALLAYFQTKTEYKGISPKLQGCHFLPEQSGTGMPGGYWEGRWTGRRHQ